MANDVLIQRIGELNRERIEIQDRLTEINNLIDEAIQILLEDDTSNYQPDRDEREVKVQRIISR